MADIFLAVVRGIADFEKLVVLKRILPCFADDAEFVRLFLDEARLAATLQHANIVQVFDIGSEEGGYFFAMEYIVGVDLRRLLQATRARGELIPLQHSVGIVMEASAGLHYAHEKRGSDGLPLGLVHRDVSPSNVLLALEGAVKLTDFGIAKATLLHSRTEPGRLMGKAPYMSPEQCRGAPLDRRSDIFSLGTLLYQLTTGHNPFYAPTDPEIWDRITEDAIPPPSTHVPDYPPALAEILAKALQRDPAQRYDTAEALHLDLEAFAAQSGLTPSRIQLSRYVERVFPHRAAGWRQAQQDGLSMVEYATRTLDLLGPETQELVSSGETGAAPAQRSGVEISTRTLAAMPTAVRAEQGAVGRATKRILIVAGLLLLAAGGALAASLLLPEPRLDVTPNQAAPAPRTDLHLAQTAADAAATSSASVDAGRLVADRSTAAAAPDQGSTTRAERRRRGHAYRRRRRPTRRQAARARTTRQKQTRQTRQTKQTKQTKRTTRVDDDRLQILP